MLFILVKQITIQSSITYIGDHAFLGMHIINTNNNSILCNRNWLLKLILKLTQFLRMLVRHWVSIWILIDHIGSSIELFTTCSPACWSLRSLLYNCGRTNRSSCSAARCFQHGCSRSLYLRRKCGNNSWTVTHISIKIVNWFELKEKRNANLGVFA